MGSLDESIGTVSLGDILHICTDFCTWGIKRGPIGVRREAELVTVRFLSSASTKIIISSKTETYMEYHRPGQGSDSTTC